MAFEANGSWQSMAAPGSPASPGLPRGSEPFGAAGVAGAPEACFGLASVQSAGTQRGGLHLCFVLPGAGTFSSTLPCDGS